MTIQGIKKSLFFRNRRFFLLWLGQFISSCGGWINYVALNVLLYEITCSGSVLGIFFAIRTVPSLFFGPFGGFLADRIDKRKLMIICDSVRAVAILTFIYLRDVNIFFILGFMLAAFDKIYSSSSSSILPEIVNKSDLMEANSYSKVSQSITTVIGPALGGLVIGFWGYNSAFIIDSCTFVFSVITLIAMAEKILPQKVSRVRENLYLEFKDTFVFLLSSGILFYFMILRIFDGLGSGAYNTVLPIFSAKVAILGGSLYGWLLTCWGIGTFLGAVSASRLSKKINISALYCGSTLIMALGMGGTFLVPVQLAFLPPYFLSLCCIALGGFGDGVSGVVFNTALMERTPREMMGKVFGSISSFIYVSCGSGMYFAGVAMDFFPYGGVVVFGTSIIIFAILVIWSILKFRFIDIKKA